MDPERFDALARGLAPGSTRRALVGGTLGGAVAAVLSRFGAAEAKDKKKKVGKGAGGTVEAQHCASNGQRCGKNRPLGTKHNHPCRKCCSGYAVRLRNGKRKCACKPAGLTCGNPSQCCSGVCRGGRCAAGDGEVVAEQGSGTIALQSEQSGAGCPATPEGCTSRVSGRVGGGPIASGSFGGEVNATNFQFGVDALTADANGTLTLTEDGSGDSFDVRFTATLRATLGAGAVDGIAIGSFTIVGGAGRFAGATGAGAISFATATDPETGNGTVDSLTLTGSIAHA